MVIDSHALLWWLEGSDALSARAAEVLNGGASRGVRLLVPAVVLWEMRLKERRGLIDPRTPVTAWPVLLRKLDHIEIVATVVEIWLMAAELRWDHRDPADRIIAATALHHGVPVLTKDGRFHVADSPVAAVW